MDRWECAALAPLGADPRTVAAELLLLLDLPDESDLVALAEDGVKTFDAALGAGQPAILADYLGYAASRIDVLTQQRCRPQAAWDAVGALLDSRLPEGDARAAQAFLTRALASTTWFPPEEPSAAEFGALARDYLTLTLDGRREEARALVLGAVRSGTSLRSVLIDVLEAAQREIGRRWQIGGISVAQEHYCTAVTQMVLADLYPYLFAGAGTGHRLVAVDAPASLHQVGLRMVVDLLQHEGWETAYLGPVDPVDIVDRVSENQCEVLAVSASMPSQISSVAAMVAAVRSDPRTAHIKIIVGGRPFAVAPELVDVVGADGWAADATGAVDLCNRLVEVRV